MRANPRQKYADKVPARKGETMTGGRGGLLGLALLVWLVVGIQGCNRGKAASTSAPPTTEVVRTTMRITADATGNVEPIRKVEVKSKASGEVLRLHAEVGDFVRRGTLLAEIDPRDVQNAYEQAVADLEVAKARAEIAEAQLARTTQLFQAGVITQQEMESERLNYANARAALVRAETNKMLAEIRLSEVNIRAPMDGTILARNVEEGTVIQSASTNVSGGTTLFVMADLTEVQVRMLVDETDFGQIQPGQEALVQVEAYPGRRFPGVVEKIEPQAVTQQNVTMFPIKVRLDNRAGLLKPGMSAEVEVLLVERPDVLVVPNNALVTTRELAAAASVLGLDPEKTTVDLQAFQRLAQEAGLGPIQGLSGRGRSGGGARGGGAGTLGGGAQPGVSPSPGAGGAAAGAVGAAVPQEPAGARGGGGAEGVQGPRTGPGGREGLPQGVDPEAMARRRARMDSLRAMVERGEISQDSLNRVLAAMRGAPGGPGGGGGEAGNLAAGGRMPVGGGDREAGLPQGGAPQTAGGRPEAAPQPQQGEGGAVGAPPQGVQLQETAPALLGLVNTSGQPRPAVAFVVKEDGTLEPRPVLMGVNDWDNTEILAGLQEGEKVALIGVAQLQAAQQALRERMASRGFMPGIPPMGGGMGGMGGGIRR